jgi:hypothetical protein
VFRSPVAAGSVVGSSVAVVVEAGDGFGVQAADLRPEERDGKGHRLIAFGKTVARQP